jgi:hypothetical protein
VLCAAIALTTISGCGGDGEKQPTDGTQPAGADTVAAPTAETPAALTPGRIMSQVFEPKLSVELANEGWTLGDDAGDVFAVEHDATRGGATFCYVAVFKPRELRNPDLFEQPLPLTDDNIGWIAAHKYLTVKEPPSDVMIGELPARRVDIAAENGGFTVPLFDDFVMGTEDRVLFAEVLVEGERLLIAAGGDHPSFWADTRMCFDPVLASIRFD